MREAIIQLSDAELEAIGIADVVEATREASLRDVTELVCHGAGGILQVRVAEPIPPADLDRFESVVWWERLTSSAAGVTYLCKVEPTHDAEHGLDERATAHDVASVHEGGIDLSVVGSQDEISESVAANDEAGMNPILRRLTSYEGSAANAAERLTDRQRDVLRTAYEMGYYDVPREASTEDVAAAVGLDSSTVAEHLQRAERNVLDALFDGV
ncbi:MAG: helix-turn-helix domain-containing protein [Halobacteriaceae archaeon]